MKLLLRVLYIGLPLSGYVVWPDNVALCFLLYLRQRAMLFNNSVVLPRGKREREAIETCADQKSMEVAGLQNDMTVQYLTAA